MFPGGKRKAVTFSYDDNVAQDIRLAEIFNRYGLKCTFNVNSELPAAEWVGRNEIPMRSMSMQECREVYAGHEAAVHTLTHPHLEKEENLEEIRRQILQDKQNIERAFGYEVRGMAYPYGTYDQRVLEILKESGIQYARTTLCTNGFEPQENRLEFKATCHHNAPNLMELADQFLALNPETPQIFYIWGHSYEFDVDQNWDKIEQFCEKISGKEDIFYGTNTQVLCPETI